MNKTIQTAFTRYFLLLALLILTGCSTIDSYRSPDQSTARSLPQIPEIKRQQRAKPRYVPPQKTVARAPTAVVKTYPKTVIQSNESLLLSKEQQVAKQQLLQKQAQKNATVDIDPYAAIPETSSNNKPSVLPKQSAPSKSASSPAVKSLMTAARADIALGKSRSAISKLERGLRIEPENAQVWHMLAKAHYANSAYLHSVSMAKKSNANTNDADLINENWKLIKQAGERSGNASVIKEALDYMKLNP